MVTYIPGAGLEPRQTHHSRDTWDFLDWCPGFEHRPWVDNTKRFTARPTRLLPWQFCEHVNARSRFVRIFTDLLIRTPVDCKNLNIFWYKNNEVLCCTVRGRILAIFFRILRHAWPPYSTPSGVMKLHCDIDLKNDPNWIERNQNTKNWIVWSVFCSYNFRYDSSGQNCNLNVP